MAVELRLPKVAEGDATGSVAKVLVAPGDLVAVDQSVLEVETEKAVVEVPSTQEGRVAKVHVAPGDDVHEGSLLLTLDPAAPGSEAAPTVGEAPAVAAAAPKAPAVAPVAAAPAPPAPPPPSAAPAPEAVHAAPARRAAALLPVPAAPSVRRFARELGVDLHDVQGSGPGGRIAVADVQEFVRKGLAAHQAGRAALPAPLPDLARFGPVHRAKAPRVRLATAQHLSGSWPQVPQVTQFDEADITELEELRRRHQASLAERGAKLTVTAVLLKVSALALRRYPQFNAALDLAAGEVVQRDYVHVGVAVDTDRGLLVPVVRDVDRKGIAQLALELGDLSQRARAARLAPEDMQGGSFSISNLGGIGGTGFTPIVNWPEAAILGVARQRTAPRWDGQTFSARTVLPLALSYDHRLIDGADAARFLRYVCEVLESPFLLALEG